MMTIMNLMNYSKVLFLSIFNDHFPLQTKNVYNKADRKPWVTPGILTFIRAKRRLEKKREVHNVHAGWTLCTNQDHPCA